MKTTHKSLLWMFFLWAFSGRGALAGDDAEAGRRAFAKCSSCHQVSPTARSTFGPQLRGVIGRQAGSVKDFKYSDAMRQAGFVWTEARLRAFLHEPARVVPGNNMRFWGISSDTEIDHLIAYLKSTAD